MKESKMLKGETLTAEMETSGRNATPKKSKKEKLSRSPWRRILQTYEKVRGVVNKFLGRTHRLDNLCPIDLSNWLAL